MGVDKNKWQNLIELMNKHTVKWVLYHWIDKLEYSRQGKRNAFLGHYVCCALKQRNVSILLISKIKVLPMVF